VVTHSRHALRAAALVALALGVAWAAEAPRPAPPRAAERARMVEEIGADLRDTAATTGVQDLSPRVRRALLDVPRHAFVPDAYQDAAYANEALPIGRDQTISQPFVVALMTELAAPGPDDVVLEVGTGSGYQAAILARLARRVYTIEIVRELAESAAARLAAQGFANVEVRTGDGYAGWPEHAPFAAILVTAGAAEIPAPLVAQLARGGRLVVPLGPDAGAQELVLLTKDQEDRTTRRSLLPVRFVPFTHELR
jgi:protein-L-isoaspartate(D-aspartate) O-methyltransferase